MGATAAFTIAPSSILGKSVSGQNAPSDMINLCGIGVGCQGGGDIKGNVATPDADGGNGYGYSVNATHDGKYGLTPKPQQRAGGGSRPAAKPFKRANVYGLCDVDSWYAEHMFKSYPNAKQFTDWHKVMEDKEIDCVLIATPDHNHCIIAANAMFAGKHVYVEKPMAKTIYEVRYLREVAKKTGMVTQMGNQGHNSEGTYKTIDWVNAGVIGDVKNIDMWTTAPSWRQGYIDRIAPQPIPDTLDYNLWLGPAPMKPYSLGNLHFCWRGMWDYGTGTVGDFAAHILDAPIMALNLDYPTKIQATSTPMNSEYFPLSQLVQYEFPVMGKKNKTIKATWTDNGLKSFRPDGLEDGRAIAACTYYGSKGVMMHGTHGAAPQLVPEKPGWKEPDPKVARPKNVYEDFFDAIREGKKTANNFEVSGKLTEIMLLTNVALMAQSMNMTLEYDHEKMKITNLPEANQFFHYEYRQGWELPEMQKVLPVRRDNLGGWELI